MASGHRIPGGAQWPCALSAQESAALVAALPDDWALTITGESPPGELADSDVAAAARFRDPRRRQFRAGRIAAIDALRRSGHVVSSLERARSGAPVWPPGMIGSISHTRGLVLAVVGPTDRYRGIGVDAECNGRLSERAYGLIRTPEEPADPTPQTRVLIFSAKESLYKCLADVPGGAALGFGDVVVELVDDGHWHARPAAAARRHVRPWPQVHGRWLATATHVITAAWIVTDTKKPPRPGASDDAW